MTTVLSVGGWGQERRCTAACHDARTAFCDCVCGGQYHGRGSQQVISRVGDDVLHGVFGEAAPVFGRSHLGQARLLQPERVRFHVRAVRRAQAQHANTGPR